MSRVRQSNRIAGPTRILGPLLLGAALGVAACASGPVADNRGVLLFDVPREQTEAYFRSHPLLVAPVSDLGRRDGRLVGLVIYPSTNHAPGGRGYSVVYSHRATLRLPDGATPLGEMDLRLFALVLHDSGEGEFVYDVVGTVSLSGPDDDSTWDWFRDKPDLWYRPPGS